MVACSSQPDVFPGMTMAISGGDFSCSLSSSAAVISGEVKYWFSM